MDCYYSRGNILGWRNIVMAVAGMSEYRTRRDPTKAEWVGFAARQADILRIPVCHVLAGRRYHAATRARALAWRAAIDAGHWSIIGIARTSGFDHTTILTAMKRLKTPRPLSPYAFQTAHIERVSKPKYDPRLFVPAASVPAGLRAGLRLEAAE